MKGKLRHHCLVSPESVPGIIHSDVIYSVDQDQFHFIDQETEAQREEAPTQTLRLFLTKLPVYAPSPRSRGVLWGLHQGRPKLLPRGEEGPGVGWWRGPSGCALSPTLSLGWRERGPVGGTGRAGEQLGAGAPRPGPSVPIPVSAAPPSGPLGKRRRDLSLPAGAGPPRSLGLCIPGGEGKEGIALNWPRGAGGDT